MRGIARCGRVVLAGIIAAMTADLDPILTTRRIDGAKAVRRFAGPPIDVVLVDRSSPQSLLAAVGRLCQLWGGSKYPLVPARRGGLVAKAWSTVHEMPLAHVFKGTVRTAAEGAKSGDGLPGWTANSLLALIAGQPDGSKGHIRIGLPDVGDPWYEAYLGALGWLPEVPDEAVLDTTRLIPNLRFEDLVEISREVVDHPSPDDLLTRLGDERRRPPTIASLWHLAPSPVPSKTKMKGELPDPTGLVRDVGPRIVVVYRPGSIEDACLLWTLRSIHGASFALPLGAPVTDNSWESVYIDERRTFVTPFNRPVVALTSCSVPAAELREIARRHKGWEVVPFSRLLQVPLPPAAQVAPSPSSLVAPPWFRFSR